jgi:two-component system, NarL family, response regulator DesR
MIRVLIAEDQAMVRGALASLLALEDDIDAAADIAAILHLSEGTVRNYLSAAIQKLGARNRREAIAHAVEKGWL